MRLLKTVYAALFLLLSVASFGQGYPSAPADVQMQWFEPASANGTLTWTSVKQGAIRFLCRCATTRPGWWVQRAQVVTPVTAYGWNQVTVWTISSGVKSIWPLASWNVAQAPTAWYPDGFVMPDGAYTAYANIWITNGYVVEAYSSAFVFSLDL